MAFDIGKALSDGLDRTTTRVGAIFMVIMFVFGTINSLVGVGVARWILDQQFFEEFAGPTPFQPQPVPDVAPINPAIGALIWLVVGIVSLLVTIAAIRTFVGTAERTIPREHFSRWMPWTWLNFLVGGIVFAVLVGIGFVLLIIPGIFLLVTLWFWPVFVAVEDEDFITAFGSSWSLTAGNRLHLFGLGVAVVLITIIFSALVTLGGVIGGVPGIVLNQAASAITTVFSLATLAQTYHILTGDHEGDATVGDISVDDDAFAN